MDKSIDIRNLKRCAEISRQSRAGGNTPFGALLADKEGNILLEQPNVEITENKCTGHAETQVAEKASRQYSKDFLKDCTLYTTAEPCAMCAGAIYWAGIGRVVYGMSEKDLLAHTGADPRIQPLTCPAVRYLQGVRRRLKWWGRSRNWWRRLPAYMKDIGTIKGRTAD